MSLLKRSSSILLVLVIFVLQGSLFSQDVEPRFQQTTEGLICMEAENYTGMRESGDLDTYWTPIETPENYSGDGGMQAQPAGEERHKTLADAQANSPVLEYAVEFVIDAPVYIWLRASHTDGYDDSAWFGLDELIYGEYPIQFNTDEQSFADEWFWISHLMDDDGSRATLDINGAGVYVFEVFMREPSFKFDKIVMHTNEDYLPFEHDGVIDTSYAGPEETLVPNAIETSDAIVPMQVKLAQNYPNPFNPSTTIAYSLPNSDFVTLKIFNTAGQEIATLVNDTQTSGDHQISWTADGFPSGIYFYRLQVGNFSETRKLLLQK